MKALHILSAQVFQKKVVFQVGPHKCLKDKFKAGFTSGLQK